MFVLRMECSMSERQSQFLELSIFDADNISIAISNCELTGSSSLVCHLAKNVKVDNNTGIANGYIVVEQPSNIPNIMSAILKDEDNDKFKSIDSVNHVYASIKSNLKLKIQEVTLHNVYLNRYKSYSNIFYFIAKMDISDLDKFEKLNRREENECKSIEGFKRTDS